MAEAPEESEPLVPQQGADGRHSDEHDGMSVELQDLVASVQAEWQDSSTQNTLRQRRPRAASVLDEVCCSTGFPHIPTNMALSLMYSFLMTQFLLPQQPLYPHPPLTHPCPTEQVHRFTG